MFEHLIVALDLLQQMVVVVLQNGVLLQERTVREISRRRKEIRRRGKVAAHLSDVVELGKQLAVLIGLLLELALESNLIDVLLDSDSLRKKKTVYYSKISRINEP